jgi:hypothetical protein
MQTAPAVFTPSGLRARVVKIVSPQPCLARRWSATLAAVTIVVLCLASVAVGGLTLVEATAFAQPLGSARTLTRNLTSSLQAPVAADSKTERPQRQAPAGPSPAQSPKTAQPAVVPPRTAEPNIPAASQEPPAASETHSVGAASVPAVMVTSELPSIPPALPAPQVSTQAARSVWTTAAGSGVAIGRKSKDAGVATAGFFSRVARRAAGSF